MVIFMYSVSEDYKRAIREKVVSDRIGGSIVLSDGASLTISDRNLVKNSLKISHELCDDYRIGTFHIGCLQIAVFDDNALLRDFSGARIEPVYEIETAKGWERVPMGIYYTDGNSVRRKRNTVSLTAYDCGCFFDRVIPEERRTLSGTAQTLVKAACDDCGVTFGGIPETLPNYQIVLSAADRQVQTYRDLVAWCAELLCAYAVIDRGGKLWFRSAKYGVIETDQSDILIDKYLTEAERDSIYVTDTRAYIQTICAYSGGVLKTYASDAVQTDEQTAAAGYTFDENPLLPETLSGEERDKINTDRLAFMDGFKQRGIRTEIYGDPALDAGDILRCSGGDVDQRRSIVGLVTKQEWRYRNLHTVVCAAPPLLGRDAASAAVVASQTKKKLDSLSGSKAVTAGIGVEIKSNVIDLKPAKEGYYFDSNWKNLLGGVYIDKGTTGSGDTLEVYNGALRLLPAKSGRIGGVSPGKGLTMIDEKTIDEPKGKISLNLGKGLRFNQPPKESSQTDTYWTVSPDTGDGLIIDPSEDKTDENYGKIHLNLGNGLEFGARKYEKDEDGNDDPTRYTSEVRVKLGEGMRFGTGGELIASAAAYKAGENIAISEDGTISAQVKEYKAGKNITISDDGTIDAEGTGGAELVSGGGITIETDEETGKQTVSAAVGEGAEIRDGKICTVPNIQNAVMISEKDAQYLLHNFTEIEYNSGSQIGYAGSGNQIILQEQIAYRKTSAAPNGIGLTTDISADTQDSLPDITRYSSLEVGGAYIDNVGYLSKIWQRPSRFGENYATYQVVGLKEDNTECLLLSGFSVDNNWSGAMLSLIYSDITPPGFAVPGTNFYPEFGCSSANLAITYKYVYYRYMYRRSTRIYIPFKSLAEYQAAVGLTYEPLTRTRVEDNPTVVSESEVN